MRTNQRYDAPGALQSPCGQTAPNTPQTVATAYQAAVNAPKDFRAQINAHIGSVAALYGYNLSQTYIYLCGRMLTVWGIEVSELPRLADESLLSVLVRYRLDSRFYALIQSELNAPAE